MAKLYIVEVQLSKNRSHLPPIDLIPIKYMVIGNFILLLIFVTAGGVQPSRALRATALRQRQHSRGQRPSAESRQTRRPSWPRDRGGLRPGRQHSSGAGQPQSSFHLLAGGLLQATAKELLQTRRTWQCTSWQNCHRLQVQFICVSIDSFFSEVILKF